MVAQCDKIRIYSIGHVQDRVKQGWEWTKSVRVVKPEEA